MIKFVASIIKRSGSNERGVTLIELLAAMTILSIIVLSFVAISQYVSHQNSHLSREAVALTIAQETMDKIMYQIEQSAPAVHSIQSVESWGQDPSYMIHLQDTELNTPISTPWENEQLSLQSIVTMNDNGRYVPRLLTVTVYWGE